MPFADVVAVPRRYVNGHVALHNGLTTQTRVELEIRRLLHAVEFVVIHLGEVVHPVFHHHVARGACTTATAGMLQMEAEIHGDIEQRSGLAMILIRQLAGFELERLVGG